MKLLVVKLDHPKFADEGTVTAIVSSVKEFHALTTDRDGTHDRRFRFWEGQAEVGDRVRLTEEVKL